MILISALLLIVSFNIPVLLILVSVLYIIYIYKLTFLKKYLLNLLYDNVRSYFSLHFVLLSNSNIILKQCNIQHNTYLYILL